MEKYNFNNENNNLEPNDCENIGESIQIGLLKNRFDYLIELWHNEVVNFGWLKLSIIIHFLIN